MVTNVEYKKYHSYMYHLVLISSFLRITIIIISTMHRKKTKNALWFTKNYGLLSRSLALSKESAGGLPEVWGNKGT